MSMRANFKYKKNGSFTRGRVDKNACENNNLLM